MKAISFTHRACRNATFISSFSNHTTSNQTSPGFLLGITNNNNLPVRVCRRSFKMSTPPHSQTQATRSKEDDKTEADPQHAFKSDMSESFGEGYATRSSEEGFGGVYGSGPDQHQIPGEPDSPKRDTHHEDDYDKSQGSDVKDKEHARHATQESAFRSHEDCKA